MKVKINTHGNALPEVHGEWIDLCTAEDVTLDFLEYKIISLGVSIEIPAGYYAHVVPRSSTFGKWGILLANSMGVIENDYCGDGDVWGYPALCLRKEGTHIPKGTRICQFRLVEKAPDMEGSEQVRTVLDMTADAWKKVYLTEDWPESINNVLGLNLAPYAQGEQDTEKLKVAAAPNGLWCSACRCKVDGELIFYNEAYLAPLAEEIKKSEYIYYTARQTQTGQRYLVVHDGMDVLAAIMPMNILKEEYINDLAEFQALCMEQFYKDKERREAVIEEAEDDAEDAGQIGMEGVEDGE